MVKKITVTFERPDDATEVFNHIIDINNRNIRRYGKPRSKSKLSEVRDNGTK